ncbi:DUF6510 family protein [Kribbella sp. NPDC051620]|uniref:DUF6510 family protein n=1 Tax=Kribbella sp. NPDC051620 TaxID=3364120 RepID=UPI003792F75A
MTHLDGNAIGGTLYDVFGAEMTATPCTCGRCGHEQAIAEMLVYTGGPGTVARCVGCSNVLIVVVDRRGIACVDLTGVASMGEISR